MARITLLTDFGTRDGYVGAMRGVIAAIAPDVRVDDVSHDLQAGDIVAASSALERYWRLYPPGTVHVVVVDPGVGTARRGIAVETDGRRFVGPDNGVFTPVLEAAARVVELRETAWLHHPVSATFHGRDVFAPVAAHLARGVGIDALGPRVVHPVLVDRPRLTMVDDAAHGVVVITDRFGNLVTNIPGALVPEAARARIAGREVPVLRTYGEAEPGRLLALVGSSGYLEIAVRDGSAADALGVGRGADVMVRPPR